MENILKKRLALIKSRASRLRRLRSLSGLAAESTSGEPIEERGPVGGDVQMPSGEHGSSGLLIPDSGAFPPDLREILPGDWPSGTLEELIPGEERTLEGDKFYLIRLTGSEIDEWADEEAMRFRREKGTGVGGSGESGSGMDPRSEPLTAAKDRACFFDIETTGLSTSTYSFLCGMMFLENGRFVVEQAFARDYEEEGGVLRYVRERFEAFDAVITYNGKTFDIPFIQARMAVNRIDFEKTFFHLDLLGWARRAYSRRLENCRLETVERHLRSSSRVGDIPGSQIPAAYHAFVRTGEAGMMERVLYHNRMDLIAMAILYNRLWPSDPPS